MFKFRHGQGSRALLSALLVLSPGLNTLVASYPSLGPKDTLDIVNKVIAPDGFERSYVLPRSILSRFSNVFRAVLVKGVHPAPLIKAVKVCNVSGDDHHRSFPLNLSYREIHSA